MSRERRFLFLTPLWRLAASLFAMCLIEGCSTGSTSQEAASPVSERRILQVVGDNIHFRRPLADPADPDADPGTRGFTSQPLPNAHHDCERLPAIFRGLKIPAIRTCLNSLMNSSRVHYVLHPGNHPYLELDSKPPLPPTCLKAELNQIPVPREIFFQSEEPGQLNCFSSHLEEGSLLETLQLTIHFPLRQALKDDAQAIRLLSTWVISPFWRGDPPAVTAKLVADAICDQCFTPGTRVRSEDPEPQLWPPTDAEWSKTLNE